MRPPLDFMFASGAAGGTRVLSIRRSRQNIYLLGEKAMRQLSTHRANAIPVLAAIILGSLQTQAAPTCEVYWNGDFADGMTLTGESGATYTLSKGADNTITDGKITIGSASQTGAIINSSASMGTDVSILVKYTSLASSVTDIGALGTVLCANQDGGNAQSVGARWRNTSATDLVGFYETTSANTYCFSQNGDGTDNAAPVPPASGYLLLVCDCTNDGNGFTACYAGSSLEELSGGYVTGLRFTGGRVVKGFALGGPRTDSFYPACSGMVIEAVAVFKSVYSGTSITDFSDFVFPPKRITIDSTAITATQINAAAGDYAVVVLTVPANATITLDTALAPSKLHVVSSGNVTLASSGNTQPAAAELAKLDLSGVSGAAKRSWLTPGVVGVNFVPNYGSDTSVALVPCDTWVVSTDWHGGTESDSSNGLFADGLSTLKWSAAAVYAYTGTSSILGGYIDDGYNNGKGAEITLSGIPYETYDIIIYASTDTSNTKFLPKTVNGVTYTWDDTQSRTVEGSANWGASRIDVPTYGINALRVNNLTGPLLITGGVKDGSIRGGIAALQIMPAGTPESERVLTLNGQNVSWSAADWKNESGSTIQPPTSGNASIVFTGSSTLTIDTNVSLDSLEVSGATNAVLTIVTGAGSLTATIATVRGGVLRQGSDTVLGTTTKIYVADGGTFDMNGRSVNQATAIYLSGAGAGSWPWALTSSSGASGAILGGIYLTGNATIGGANELKIGQTGAGYYCYLLGFTLTKTGAGALTGTNMNTPGTGTIDLQGGAMSVNQWNNLNSNVGDTTVILRPGTSLANKTDRPITMNTLFLLGGSLDSSVNPFGVKNLLAGAGSTSKLTFNESTVFKPNGTGYLRATESFTLPNNTMTIDISEVDFTTGRAVPLFTVGPAVSLPDASAITLVGGTLPEGWIMAKTTSGRGYRLINRNRQLRLILR